MTQRVIRAVIFDLDGVLIDSAPYHRTAFEQVLLPCGITDFDYSIYAGWRTPEVIQAALTRAGLSLSAEAVHNLAGRKSRIARELLSKTNSLVKDAASVLRRLSAHYVLALASSGSRESIQMFLDANGCHGLFRSVLSGADVTRPKPDPEIYCKTFGALDLTAADCAVIEDSVAGVRAAKAAGAIAIGLAGTCSRQTLLDAGSDRVIDALAELPSLLFMQDRVQPPEIGTENWRQFASPRVCASDWTAIVPAAGRGSRLGFDHPKILYPVGGRMILEWLLDLCLPNCARIAFVLAPAGSDSVETELERLAPGRYDVVIQEVPTGMGDAVELGIQAVSTEFVVIIWGDQVALRPSSVEACLRLHQGVMQPDVTCPTVIRRDPYIHFERDADGRLSSVRQAREGDSMPVEGESDAGFFCFRTAVLRELLDQSLVSAAARGKRTTEFNFVPIIPAAAQRGHAVLTPHLVTLEETVGINTKNDAMLVEEFLRSSHVQR